MKQTIRLKQDYRSTGLMGAASGVTPGVAGYNYDLQYAYKSELPSQNTDVSDAPLMIVFRKDWLQALIKQTLGYKTTVDDLTSLAKLFKEMGLEGKFYEKVIKDVKCVVLKGYAGNRVILKKTWYPASSSQMVSFALGRSGAIRNALKSGVWTIIAVACWDLVSYALGDEKRASDLLAELISDTMKVAIGTLASAFVAAAVSGTGVAVAPLAAGIVVGVAVGIGLDYLDNKYKVTERLADGIQHCIDIAEKKVEETEQSWATWYYYNVEKPIMDMLIPAGFR